MPGSASSTDRRPLQTLDWPSEQNPWQPSAACLGDTIASNPWLACKSPTYTTPPTPYTFSSVESFQWPSVVPQIYGFAPDYKTAYNYQWNVSVQREIAKGLTLQLGYIGNRGRNLTDHRQHQLGRLQHRGPDWGNMQARRPNQGFRRDLHRELHLQEQVRRPAGRRQRPRGRLALRHSHLHLPARLLRLRRRPHQPGHALSRQSQGHWKGSGRRTRTISPSSSSSPGTFRFLEKNTSALGKILGGWQISGNGAFYSGSPLDVNSGWNEWNFDGVPGDRPDLVGTIEYPKTTNSDGTVQWVSPNAFARPASHDAFGNLQRNAVFGPGWWNVDAALLKNFRLTQSGGRYFQFRLEAYNLFNRKNLNSPTMNFPDDNFGKIYGRNGNRLVQIGSEVLLLAPGRRLLSHHCARLSSSRRGGRIRFARGCVRALVKVLRRPRARGGLSGQGAETPRRRSTAVPQYDGIRILGVSERAQKSEVTPRLEPTTRHDLRQRLLDSFMRIAILAFGVALLPWTGLAAQAPVATESEILRQGAALEERGDLARARFVYLDGLRRFPKSAELPFRLGTLCPACSRTGWVPSSTFARISSDAPGTSNALYYLSQAYYLDGQPAARARRHPACGDTRPKAGRHRPEVRRVPVRVQALPGGPAPPAEGAAPRSRPPRPRLRPRHGAPAARVGGGSQATPGGRREEGSGQHGGRPIPGRRPASFGGMAEGQGALRDRARARAAQRLGVLRPRVRAHRAGPARGGAGRHCGDRSSWIPPSPRRTTSWVGRYDSWIARTRPARSGSSSGRCAIGRKASERLVRAERTPFEERIWEECRRLLVQNEEAQALAYLNSVLEAGGGDPHYLLGVLYFNLDRGADAVRLLTWATAISPEDADALAYLGRAHVLDGADARADEVLARALALQSGRRAGARRNGGARVCAQAVDRGDPAPSSVPRPHRCPSC